MSRTKAIQHPEEIDTYQIHQENWFISKLKDQSISLALIFGATIISLATAYVAYQLAPLVKDLDSLTQRVSAIESDRAVVKERFFKVEDTLPPMKEDISEIKVDIREIKNYLYNKNEAK